MKPNKKILWALADGSIKVTTPEAPMRGAYIVSDGMVEDTLYVVDGSPVTSKRIATLDQLVAQGKVRFAPSETEQEYLNRRRDRALECAAQMTSSGKQADPGLLTASYRYIDAAKHDAIDVDFPNALTADGEPDMPKARELKRDQLRALRAPLLTALDTDYMRADETGDTAEKQRIAALKQELRDVTADPAIEAARTPEELKATIPAALSVAR